MYTPKHLKRWTTPSNYIGASWHGYYSSGFGRSRDSDPLEESNFQVAWEALEKLDAVLVSESHFLVGWVEWIAIPDTNETALRKADELRAKYEIYPVLDEAHLGMLEEKLAAETWKNSTLRYRIELCADNEISIFAARHDFPPYDDSGRIQERLLRA
jgi:hypothetical protein